MVLKSKSRFSYANVASTLALVIAIGGGGAATAAALTLPRNSVGSPQIINGAVHGVDIHASTITGGKVAGHTLTGANIAGGTVTGANVKDHSLGHADFTTAPVGLVQGYVWDSVPASTLNTAVNIGAPGNAYAYNSSGGAITVTRTGVGVYEVTFVGLDFYPGNVQVTAYGGGSEQCKSGGWGTDTAAVVCFDSTGAPVNTLFDLSVIK
ncbi:MAG: hypothetical protein JWR52_2027 [Marmoricola sp.]|nr:hypothetical protein [Marmoricola sp.]